MRKVKVRVKKIDWFSPTWVLDVLDHDGTNLTEPETIAGSFSKVIERVVQLEHEFQAVMEYQKW